MIAPTFKKCPFCGNKGITHSIVVLEEKDGSNMETIYTECKRCGATGPRTRISTLKPAYDRMTHAAYFWNQRGGL